MTWQWTFYTILPLAVTVVLITTALYVLRYRLHLPETKFSVIFLFSCAGLMAAYLFEIASADLEAKIFWNKIQYMALIATPIAAFLYSATYTRHQKALQPHNLALLSVIPIVILLLIFTNEAHGLVWQRVWLSTDRPIPEVNKVFGIGFWAMVIYDYALMSVSVFLHIKMLVLSRRIYRWQASILVFAILLAYLGAAFDVLQINLLPRLVATLLGIASAGLVGTFTIYHLRRSDIVAVSHKAIIEEMRDAVMVLDAQNCIVDLNAATRQLIGTTATRAVGQHITQIWPDWQRQVDLPCCRTEVSKEITMTLGQEQRIYDMLLTPLTDWRDNLVSQVVVLRDITERVRAEEKIKASLQEKEALLKEIHHRVKNNLQVISSLLSIQSRAVVDTQTRKLLKESQNRIKSISLVHEKLYRSSDLAQINFTEYARDLVAHLYRTYHVQLDVIALQLDVNGVALQLDTAIPCGLMVNELISNALKHGFPNGQRGEIYIGLHAEDDQVTLTVRDNGIGFPTDMDFYNTDSLGLQLINMLAAQLEGTVTFSTDNGASVSIMFSES